MKKILIINIIIPINLIAQNLLKNPSFENKKTETPVEVPYRVAQFQFVSDWKEDMTSKKKFLSTDTTTYYLHSPDFYSTAPSSTGYVYDANLNGSPINAKAGFNYVGMARAELIQQRFGEDNPLSNSQNYNIKFYIQPSYAFYFDNVTWTSNCIKTLVLLAVILFVFGTPMVLPQEFI